MYLYAMTERAEKPKSRVKKVLFLHFVVKNLEIYSYLDWKETGKAVLEKC